MVSKYADEKYNDHYFREVTVRGLDVNVDLLLVIGSPIDRKATKRLINQTLAREDVPVIEINELPSIEEGFVFQVIQNCDDALVEILDSYYRLKKES